MRAILRQEDNIIQDAILEQESSLVESASAIPHTHHAPQCIEHEEEKSEQLQSEEPHTDLPSQEGLNLVFSPNFNYFPIILN